MLRVPLERPERQVLLEPRALLGPIERRKLREVLAVLELPVLQEILPLLELQELPEAQELQPWQALCLRPPNAPESIESQQSMVFWRMSSQAL